MVEQRPRKPWVAGSNPAAHIQRRHSSSFDYLPPPDGILTDPLLTAVDRVKYCRHGPRRASRPHKPAMPCSTHGPATVKWGMDAGRSGTSLLMKPFQLCHLGLETGHTVDLTSDGSTPSSPASVSKNPPQLISPRLVKVQPGPDGCWLWIGYTDKDGYGRSGPHFVHRTAYRLHVGPIPDGMTIDHLCRVRNCCNPAHLEAVTTRENTFRGETFARHKAAQTHCVRGHVFDEKNTGIKYPPSHPNGMRFCRECNNARRRKNSSTSGA